jgi:hypothetical protein
MPSNDLMTLVPLLSLLLRQRYHGLRGAENAVL